MSLLDAHVKVTVDGYDLAAERDRYAFDDVVVGGLTLNRGTATVEIHDEMNSARLDEVRRQHAEEIFPTTLSGDLSPVVELGFPQAGHYVRCAAGTYFDAYLGVAQKLIDEQHPRLRAVVASLREHGVLLRREINTDDYLVFREGVEGLRTPQELAALINRMTEEAFPQAGRFKSFFSNSGAEAVEAGIKMALRVAHSRLQERYGAAVESELMRQLGIGKLDYFERSEGETVYADHPFFVIACEGAFHGRTLGSLQLTCSKAVHKAGYHGGRWSRHVPFSRTPQDLAELLDARPLDQILEADGGIAAILDAGRIPRDLAALFVAEGFQGEGGYILGDAGWFQEIRKLCDQNEILLLLDEIQSFGRTGRPFVCQHFGIEPDIVTLAKSAVVGVTVARADLARHLPVGWHANTWGGGKVFDVNVAWTTLDTYLHHEDPLFEGRNYVDNSRIKGEYLRSNLAWLRDRHPDVLVDFSGLGGMFGLTLRRREDVVRCGWRHGLKLLGCGAVGEESRVRLLLLADVLTREIDDLTLTLDRVLTEVGSS